jgi:hypothetical protein
MPMKKGLKALIRDLAVLLLVLLLLGPVLTSHAILGRDLTAGSVESGLYVFLTLAVLRLIRYFLFERNE